MKLFKRNYSDFKNIAKCANSTFENVTLNKLKNSIKINNKYLKYVVNKEFKNRLAKQIILLESCPYGLNKMPSIEKTIINLVKSFDEIKDADETDYTNKNCDEYKDKLKIILDRHENTPFNICKGIYEWKNDIKTRYKFMDYAEFTENIDASLCKFYNKRMSSRIIASNYIKICEKDKTIVNDNLILGDVLNCAIIDAQNVCYQKYMIYPNINIIGNINTSFSYIDSYLYYVIFELLKNSYEASVLKNKINPPDINVHFTLYNKKPIIKIHDEGIGIKPNNIDNIFSYMYTTSDTNIQSSDSNDTFEELTEKSSMSGFGHGLPMSKLILNYFGGDIKINSIYGICTDVYLYL